ncbi:MAG: Ig-like domain-containing protein [Gemmatimonadota bacterium]|nr:Ig-like domain-containing protein [Gemmatimonadota bacterium]
MVAAASVLQAAPNPLALTHARLLLRPIGLYGDSAVVVGDWVADSAVITLPVSVVGTSQFFDLFVTATNARGDTLLRGHSRIRLYSVFTIATRLALDYVGPDANLATLRIAPRDTTVARSGTFAMRATGADAAGAPVTPVITDWTSRNTALFTVSATGRVTAGTTPGVAFIVATSANGKKDSTTITVAAGGITSTVVTPQRDSIGAFGDSHQLAAQAFSGSTPVAGTFTWVSRNPSVVTVTPNGGLITAVANGTTYVVATEAGGTKDSALVLIKQRINRLTLAPPAASIAINGTQQFTLTAFDANNNPITNLAPFVFAWASTADAIATVGGTGLATGHAVGGPVTIRVSSGGLSATALLTVISNIASVTVTPSPIAFDRLGQSIGVTATARDAGGAVVSGATFRWAIANPAVATITGSTTNTNTVTSAGNGSTTLNATADGVSSAPVTVSVAQLLASIEIKSMTQPPAIAPGGKLQMVARGKDANGFYLRTPFTVDTWISSDPTDLPIDANGVVTGNQPEIRGSRGSAAADRSDPTANITAKKGAITSNIVSVLEDFGAPAKKIVWDRDTLFVAPGASVVVHLYGTVPVAHTLTLRYTTPNGSVVTVPASNVIYAIGSTDFTVNLQGGAAGTTTVTVTDTGGEFTGSTITVVVGSAPPIRSVGTRRP